MKLPTVEVNGRFMTKYDPAIALDIVSRIADGETLVKITAKNAQPQTVTKATFLRWVATVPELTEAYAAATKMSAHTFEEMAIEKARDVANAPGSPANVSAANLLVSQYRWSAARRDPKYSDKGSMNIVVPVQINTTLDMGPNVSAGGGVEVPDMYTIELPALPVEEGEFTELPEGEAEGLSPVDHIVTAAQAKEQFRALLRPEVPVKGMSRQPMLRSNNKGGHPRGPVKRVLTPRIKS